MPPTLIIVNGLPATGKTTLSERIAGALALPLFSKDMFKEILFDTLGWGERAWSRQLSQACYALLYRLAEVELALGRSCVVESNFHAPLSRDQFHALRERVPFHPAEVLCVTDLPVLLKRWRARAAGHAPRHPGHRDDVLAGDEMPVTGRLEPLMLGGALIEVDTTDPAAVDLDDLVGRLRALLAT